MKEYIITKEDVGRSFRYLKCGACGHNAEFLDFRQVLGKVMPQDVGKIMRKRGEVWQVENDEQHEARRIRELEAEGLTHSDAVGAFMAEVAKV